MIAWRDVVTESEGSLSTLGAMVNSNDMALTLIEVVDGAISSWPYVFLSLPGRSCDTWDADKSAVDWTGFESVWSSHVTAPWQMARMEACGTDGGPSASGWWGASAALPHGTWVAGLIASKARTEASARCEYQPAEAYLMVDIDSVDEYLSECGGWSVVEDEEAAGILAIHYRMPNSTVVTDGDGNLEMLWPNA